MSASCLANRSISAGSSSRFASAATATTWSRLNPEGMPDANMPKRVAMTAHVRKAAVAGSWYPGRATALAAAVDAYLAGANGDVDGELVALIAPHAGLMYSGPVAAHAYHLLQPRSFDVAVLVGPSHFVGFDGVSIVRS